MKKKKNKSIKPLSTFDKLMQNPEWKAGFEKGYEEFLLSEFLIEAMEENNISVRKLAKEAGVSPTVIQNLRSGKRSNISLNTLTPILSALHYKIEFVKQKPTKLFKK
jgi:DNA-binding Xre family transcriptional regulator